MRWDKKLVGNYFVSVTISIKLGLKMDARYKEKRLSIPVIN